MGEPITSASAPSAAGLFREYGREMVRRARSVLGSEADAEDAVQEVVLALLEAPDLLATVDRVAGWLYTVVRRRSIDMARARSRRARREGEAGIVDVLGGVADPETKVRGEELAAAVARAIRELPETQREVFVANALDGVTFRELSDRTGTPIGTLLSRKKRATDRIRARLRSEGFLAGGGRDPRGR